jgi:putative hemolysin
MITTELLIIFILLLLNAFFALSEMAIVSSSKPMLRQMAKQGNRRAAAALKLAEDSGRFLSTVQVGITLVGTLAGAYGGAEIADKLAPGFNDIDFINPNGEIVAVVLVVACITYFSVVIGELIPKQFALSKPEKLAMFVAKPMMYLSIACTPVVSALEGSANLFFKLFGIRREAEKVTEAEVKAMLAEGVASGAIEPKEHDMLQRIIRLGDRDVKSIMTHRVDVSFIDVKDDLQTIRRKVHESGHSRYPVIDGDVTRIIGIVQAKELLDEAFNFSEDLHLVDHIREAPIFTETTKCLEALEIFKNSPVHIAVVVDEYGAAAGIFTAADLLEAIVGIMPSNYDADDEPLIVEREDGSWLVDGTTPIDEIHLVIGLEEIDADADYDTIAGFMLYSMGRKPDVGEFMERFGYRFEVVDLDRTRIDKILIARIPDQILTGNDSH